MAVTVTSPEPLAFAPLNVMLPVPALAVLMTPVKPLGRVVLLTYVSTAGFQVSEPVKLPSKTPVGTSMAIVATICWPTAGASFDALTDDAAPPQVASAKFAVTLFAASIVTAHVPVPLHPAPLQPVNVDPAEAAAVSVTDWL